MYGKIEIEVKCDHGRQTTITGELHNAGVTDKVFLLLDIADSMDLTKAELFAAIMTYDDFKKVGTHTRIDMAALERMKNNDREDP